MIHKLELPMPIIYNIDGKRLRSRISVEYLDDNQDTNKSLNINGILKREYDRRALERTSINRIRLDT